MRSNGWCPLLITLALVMFFVLGVVLDHVTLLASTYAVVVFSVLVQGLTVRRLLIHYGVGLANRR